MKWLFWDISLPFSWSISFPTHSYSLPQYLVSDLLACCIASRASLDLVTILRIKMRVWIPRMAVLQGRDPCFGLYPKCPQQDIAHSWCSKNICWINEWKMQKSISREVFSRGRACVLPSSPLWTKDKAEYYRETKFILARGSVVIWLKRQKINRPSFHPGTSL